MQDTVLEILEEICEDSVVRENPDIHLFDNGLLDSLGVASLVVELEEQLDIHLILTEINREDIETPRKLLEYLQDRVDA
ncbi:MAG: D-alanine--poly(phosphoribitol) ligase subunit DltC [Eubacteriales bacterium]|nr:D-alanine--poly(phosphoribitol) ligase subunit DltC [Eubacteriales bacterium]